MGLPDFRSMTHATAHACCLALVVADGGARSVRMWILFRGLGRRTPLGMLAASTGLSDLAASLTPMRLGGFPAQAAFFTRAGIPLPIVAAAVALEALATYPVVAGVGAWIATHAGAAWVRDAREAVADTHWSLPLIIAALATLGGLWLLRAERGRLPDAVRAISTRSGVALEAMRRVPWWVPPAAIVATLVHVVARLALLPLLTRAVPAAPQWTAAFAGSFALLYGQLVSPSPSGAGLAEALGRHGLAGVRGDDATWVVFWWRVYSLGAIAFALPLVVPRLRRLIMGA